MIIVILERDATGCRQAGLGPHKPTTPSNHVKQTSTGCIECKRLLINCNLIVFDLSNLISGGGSLRMVPTGIYLYLYLYISISISISIHIDLSII